MTVAIASVGPTHVHVVSMVSHASCAAVGLSSIGLDRSSLLASGLPQHSINSLYRSLAAHAGVLGHWQQVPAAVYIIAEPLCNLCNKIAFSTCALQQ